MKQEYLNKVKEDNPWFFDEDFECNVILSDDLDSLLSFLVIKKYRPKWHLGYFFNYRTGLYEKRTINEDLPVVGIDLSLCSGRCISNHITSLDGNDYNKQDINLSNINGICLKNYHEKYNLNTLCLIYSLLGLKPKNKVEATILLLPDGAYKPFYQPKEYRDYYVQKQYLYDMGLENVWNIQNGMKQTQFWAARDAINADTKLFVDEDGIRRKEPVPLKLILKYMGLKYDPALLKGFFYLKHICKSYKEHTYKKPDKTKYFSFAVTSKKFYKYSK